MINNSQKILLIYIHKEKEIPLYSDRYSTVYKATIELLVHVCASLHVHVCGHAEQ